MNYFSYNRGKNNSPFRLVKIFKTVQKMEGLAKSRYGTRYQDALDEAFFHIVDNYDDSLSDDCNSLERYTSSIVSTIYRNHNKREVVSDMVLGISADSKSAKEASEKDPWEDIGVDTEKEFSDDVLRCIYDLLPNFLKDYEVFQCNPSSSSSRKMNYSSIYKVYSDRVIMEAVSRLSKYYEEAKYLSTVSSGCTLRSFSPDRYKSSMDDSISMLSIVNGIVVCSVSPHARKNIYRVHISEFIDDAISNFYSCNGVGHRVICGCDVYCTFSGREVIGVESLRRSLESEIVGSLLAKVTNIRVVGYKPGDYLYVSSSKPEEYGLVFSLFGIESILQMTIMPVRRVVKKKC